MRSRLTTEVATTAIYVCLAFSPSHAQQASSGGGAVDPKGVRHKADDRSAQPPPWMDDVIKSVGPEYPSEDLRSHRGGNGLFRLTLDLKTGAVSNITVLRSTGFGTLDGSALRALRQFRWKPGRWKEIDVPVTFWNGGGSPPRFILARPNPVFPYEAHLQGLTGDGVFRLQVRRKTGEVLAVTIVKSTGHRVFDNAAIAAFSRWRFRGGVVDVVTIPITFSR